jgi:ferredoxin-NADP reductase
LIDAGIKKDDVDRCWTRVQRVITLHPQITMASNKYEWLSERRSAQSSLHLRVTLLHADVNERSFPLRRQLIEDLARLPESALHVWFEDGTGSELPVAGAHAGIMDLSAIELPDNAVYYLCGPIPFMQAIRSALLERGVGIRDIQYEVFGPDLWQADTD